MQKLKLIVGRLDDGNLCQFNLGTTKGWDRRLWAILSPIDERPLEDEAFLRAANYIKELTCWSEYGIRWFRYHPPLGLLGPELEVMALEWSDVKSAFVDVQPRRAFPGENTWLRCMGRLPLSHEPLVEDAGVRQPAWAEQG